MLLSVGLWLVLAWPCCLAAGGIGNMQMERLFTTSLQRTKLNKVRHMKLKKEAIATKKQGVSSRFVSVDGVVVRSDGHNAIWMNGESPLKRPELTAKVEMVMVQGFSGVAVMSKKTGRVLIKPGQTLDTLNGDVVESYNAGLAVDPRQDQEPAVANRAATQDTKGKLEEPNPQLEKADILQLKRVLDALKGL